MKAFTSLLPEQQQAVRDEAAAYSGDEPGQAVVTAFTVPVPAENVDAA